MTLGDCPNHDGTARDGGEVFLEVPTDLGRILSASSNAREPARTGPRPSWGSALGFGGLMGIGGGGALGTAVAWLAGVELVIGMLVGAAVVAPVLVWLLHRPEPVRCTYVGEAGIAEVTGGGRARVRSLRFAEARELRVDERRIVVNGVHVATTAKYRWLGAGGQTLFEAQASVWPELPGPPYAPRHFVRAATRAWDARSTIAR